MKTITKILVTLGVTLFILTVGMKSEAVAQCEPGYTPKTVNFVVGGCTWQVVICYKCSPLGFGATKVKILSGPLLIPTTPPCHSTVPISGLLNFIISQIQSPSFVLTELCTYTQDVPPCDGPSPPKIITYYIPQCWQAEVIIYFGLKTVYFRTCSDDYCEVSETVCYDGSGYVRTPLPPIGTSTPDCDVEAYDILFPDPENLGPWNEGDKTDCFIYHSPCNP